MQLHFLFMLQRTFLEKNKRSFLIIFYRFRFSKSYFHHTKAQTIKPKASLFPNQPSKKCKTTKTSSFANLYICDHQATTKISTNSNNINIYYRYVYV